MLNPFDVSGKAWFSDPGLDLSLALAPEHGTFGFIIFFDLDTHISDLFKEHLR